MVRKGADVRVDRLRAREGIEERDVRVGVDIRIGVEIDERDAVVELAEHIGEPTNDDVIVVDQRDANGTHGKLAYNSARRATDGRGAANAYVV